MYSNQNQNPQFSQLAPVENSSVQNPKSSPRNSVSAFEGPRSAERFHDLGHQNGGGVGNSLGQGEVVPVSSPLHHSTTPSLRFSLTQHLGFWVLSHGNDQAILKHEIGLSYVAYLMAHPNEPIHGLALALKIRAMRNGQPADSAELIQERALALDDAEAARRLFRKQLELERLLDDQYLPEPDKHEILRQLEAIYAYQKKNISGTSNVAQRASHSVGMAIKRLYARLAKAVSADGSPNQILRAFALLIKHQILIPSGRTGDHGGIRAPLGCGGFFICSTP